MVGTFAENLADMVGGTMVVLAAAKEGEVYGGCRLAEDAVMLLCSSVPECAGHVRVPRADGG